MPGMLIEGKWTDEWKERNLQLAAHCRLSESLELS
jgi:hypothetical protein